MVVQVFALNVIQVLFRDSQLGGKISPLMARTVMVTIEGFRSEFWQLCNACTILFAMLVHRIFGAKKVRDERSVANSLSPKELFHR